jgi:alpha-L-rhamnosidase
MFSDAAGIAADDPGWKRIRVRPTPGGGLAWVRARYESIRGPVGVEWRLEGKKLTVRLTIPANTSARVYVPAASPAGVTEGGREASRSPSVRFVRMLDGYAVFDVGGGSYAFESPIP